MKTILLLTLHTSGDTVNAAMSFSSVSSAFNYINQMTNDQSAGIESLKKLREDRYTLRTSYGATGSLTIKEVPDGQLRFHLLKSVNGRYRETRAFTSRRSAVNYVVNFLDEYDFDPDEDEGKLGSWHMESGNIDVTFRLKITCIDSEDKLDKYYRTLGINRPATPEQIRRAYRKRSKETHPDMGGDAKEFQKINQAYEILINSDTTNKHKVSMREIIESPDSADIGYILNQVGCAAQEEHASQQSGTDGSAAGLIFIGLVMASIGIAATSASYNSAGEGERYTIFSGLIVVGGYYIVRGIINLLKR